MSRGPRIERDGPRFDAMLVSSFSLTVGEDPELLYFRPTIV
jgi:hypothetical protein